MNARERFVAVTRFEKPDYVPLVTCNSIDGPSPDTVRTWQRDQGFPDWFGRPSADRVIGREYAQVMGVTAELQWDWDRLWGTTRVQFWGPGSSVVVPEPEVLADDGEYLTVRHADGRVDREMYDNDSRYGMPEFIRYPLEEPQDWPSYRDRWVPMEDGVYPEDWDALAADWRARDFPLCAGLPGTFSVIRSLFGTGKAALLFYDEPELVREILRHYRERAFRRLERFLTDVPLDGIGIGEDYCYRAGCFVSPPMFREFFTPHYQEEVAFAKAHGIDFLYVDSDGFVEGVVPLLYEAGIRGLQAFEPRAGNDTLRVRADNPEFVIWGGLDKYVMDQTDPAIIDAEVDRKVPPLLESGGFFPGIDHGLPPTTYWLSYLHFIHRLHELTGNPEGAFWSYL